MGKSNLNINISDDSSQKNDWVRIISFIIIGVCIMLLLGFLALMVWRTTGNNPEVYRVIITSDISPDSLKTYNYMNFEQADSLIKAVKNYDAQLTQKYQYLVEQKEQDSKVFYWGSLIVGIVIAILGWFGFQSFATIEDKAKRKATTVANRTAWTATKYFLEEEGKNYINDAAKENLQADAVTKIKEQVISELNTIIENRLELYLPSNQIDDIDKRIESLENSIKLEIEKAAKAAVKDFFEKYKRSVSGAKSHKEEKK